MLLAVLPAAPALGSQLITRDATHVSLAVNGNEQALVTYTHALQGALESAPARRS